jgi:hypothetical protein
MKQSIAIGNVAFFAVFCIIETYVVDVDWLMVPAVDDISWMVMILPRTIAL